MLRCASDRAERSLAYLESSMYKCCTAPTQGANGTACARDGAGSDREREKGVVYRVRCMGARVAWTKRQATRANYSYFTSTPCSLRSEHSHFPERQVKELTVRVPTCARQTTAASARTRTQAIALQPPRQPRQGTYGLTGDFGVCLGRAPPMRALFLQLILGGDRMHQMSP